MARETLLLLAATVLGAHGELRGAHMVPDQVGEAGKGTTEGKIPVKRDEIGSTWSPTKSAIYGDPASSADEPCGFRAFADSGATPLGLHKWRHYFAAYEREFGRFCGPQASDVRMLEIGVASGGSTAMWRARFGAALTHIVGVDVNSGCKAHESIGSNVHVLIGSSADAETYRQVNASYPGGFDIILDDGSHQTQHIVDMFDLTFATLLRPGGVYMIEDITQENAESVRHVMQQYRYKNSPPFADAFYRHTGPKVCCEFATNAAQADVEYITEYPMMLAIRKRAHPISEFSAPRFGSEWTAKQ